MKPAGVLRNSGLQGWARGYTLIELMIVVAIVGILSSIAFPTYANHMKKSRIKLASVDLAMLRLRFEGYLQSKFEHSDFVAADTSAVKTLLRGWSASQDAFFNYSVTSTAADYTLTATGSGSMSGCKLSLSSTNARTISGGTACGGVTSW